MKSEFEIWRDELAPRPKLTIAGHAARWLDRAPAPEPQPARDVYAWVDVAELIDVRNQ